MPQRLPYSSKPQSDSATNFSPEHHELPQFANCSDLQIWQEFKRGSRAAFIYIYHQYFEGLYAYGHQFSKNTDLIKDCIHDLFVEIDQSKARLSDTTSIRLYLYKSIKRKILYTLKKRQKFVSSEDNSEAFRFNFDLPAEQKMINRQMDEERIKKLNEAVSQLTHRQREAVFYFYYEGFSFQQISELMEFQSIKATQNLLYRALKELRKILSILYWIFVIVKL